MRKAPLLFELEPCRVRVRKAPPEPIARRDVYHAGSCGEPLRYLAERRWMNSEPMVLWVLYCAGLGSVMGDDSIMRKVIAQSWRLGFGGALVASLYPACATSVDDARAWRDAARETDNWDHVTKAAIAAGERADQLKCRVRVAAWGMLDAAARTDLDEWLLAFDGKAPAWCLGISGKDGDPLQPSVRGAVRPAKDAPLVPFAYPVPIARDPPAAAKPVEPEDTSTSQVVVDDMSTCC